MPKFIEFKSKNTLVLSGMILLVFLCLLGASFVQSDYGNISVDYINIVNEDGLEISGKLYRHDTATETSPAAAVITLHGLNNDKDTEGPVSLELAKRGFVVLALDEVNHGNSDPGSDSSLGGNATYRYLQSLTFVNPLKIGLVGHSMGQSSASAIAKEFPSHLAVVNQAFGPVNLTLNDHLNNVLQLVPRYEESSNLPRDEWIAQGTSMIEYNLDQISETMVGTGYDTTYGSFALGTAQRYVELDSTHPGGTWDGEGIKETVAWMLQALNGEQETAALDHATPSTYMIKEILTLTALILLLFSSIPLVKLLLDKEYFSGITQEVPEEVYVTGKDWWKLATVNAWIGAITFLFVPILGAAPGLLGLNIPILRLGLGNGFLLWFVVNAFIAKKLFNRFKVNSGKSLAELGGVDSDDETVVFRSTILAIVVVCVFYLIAIIAQVYMHIEIRFMWSFFRVLSPIRFLQFIIYSFPIYYFFKYNAGFFLYGSARMPVQDTELKTQLHWMLKMLYSMLSGFIVVYILEYFPMFLFGTKPLLGEFALFFWLLGIFLMSIIPEFFVLYIILNVLYRMTGRIYVGSAFATLVVTWVLATGVMI
ncbi:MAG: hypothetical protein INQ03_17295 [Candidatus Heimdallarchaeota archaeon]|nr:hypothetical protein [Candidatus Heimdallarchaeota archaeon]